MVRAKWYTREGVVEEEGSVRRDREELIIITAALTLMNFTATASVIRLRPSYA